MKVADRPFVVVSGLPGSGKTTMARALGPLLNLPVIDKDDILEDLFESRGIGDAGWRRRLSRDSDVILRSKVSASHGAVVSSFWHVPGMPADSGTPSAWLADLTRTVVTVRCECPPLVAASRFAQRARHPGHLDASRTLSEIRASIEALVPFGILTVGEPVMVDTTQPAIAAEVVLEIQAGFRRCLVRENQG